MPFSKWCNGRIWSSATVGCLLRSWSRGRLCAVVPKLKPPIFPKISTRVAFFPSSDDHQRDRVSSNGHSGWQRETLQLNEAKNNKFNNIEKKGKTYRFHYPKNYQSSGYAPIPTAFLSSLRIRPVWWVKVRNFPWNSKLKPIPCRTSVANSELLQVSQVVTELLALLTPQQAEQPSKLWIEDATRKISDLRADRFFRGLGPSFAKSDLN